MTTKNFVVKNGLTTGNIILDASSSNITANVVVANLSVPASANLGNIGNVKITGGAYGQLLTTDGAGNLAWSSISIPSAYSNSNVAAYLPIYTGNITSNYISGNGSLLTFITGSNVSGNVSQAVHSYYSDVANNVSGSNVSGPVANANLAVYVTNASQPNITSVGTLTSLGVTGNITSGNASITGILTAGTITTSGTGGNIFGVNYVTSNYFVGNGSTLTYITGSNVSGNVSQAVHSYYSDVANSVAGANVSGNVSQAVHSYYSDVANSVAGANVSGNVSQAVHSYYSDVANSVAGANVSGYVANATNSNLAVYVTNASQPNITSVGTLTSLTVTGNVTGNYIIGNGSQLTGLPAGYANSNVAAYLPTYTGNITAGNVSITGTLTTGTITTSGTGGNISGVNYVNSNYFIGSGIFLANISGSNVIGNVSNAIHSYYSDVANSVTGSNVSGNVSQAVHSYYSDVANSVAAANVSGSVANSNLAVYVTNASQPNITSVGTLTSLTVSGDTTITGNLTISGNYEYANVTSFRVKDPIIEQGGNITGAALSSDDGKDRGTLLHYYTTAPVDAFMGWDNSNGEFAFGSNVSVSSEVVTFNTFGNVRAGYFVGNGATLTYITGSAVSGNVSQAVHSYYSDVANSVAGANVSGNVSQSVHSYYSDVANSVSGSNVSGQVSNALISGTVYTNAQPNITSVGTLTSLSVTGNVSANYFIGNGSQLTGLPSSYANSNVAAYLPTYTGNVAAGNLLTDHLLFANGVAWTMSGTPGGSNTYIQFNDNSSFGGSANLTFNKATNTLSVTNLVASGANLGSVSNLHITGGLTGQFLSTDGSGNLSWATASGGSGSSAYAAIYVDAFTGDGTTVNFTLSAAPGTKNNTIVNYNGALQLKSAYSISGTTLTFSEAPSNGSLIDVTTVTSVAAATGAFTNRSYTGNGSTTDYVVTNGVTVSSLIVTLNGIVQTPTTDYTVSGGTLSFTTAPTSGMAIQIRELSVVTATVSSLTAAVANVKITGGTSGQALITDGAGNLSFGSAGVPSGKIVALNMFLGF